MTQNTLFYASKQASNCGRSLPFCQVFQQFLFFANSRRIAPAEDSAGGMRLFGVPFFEAVRKGIAS